MRILYYFYELNTPMYQWQRNNLIDELKSLGWEVDTINPATYFNFEECNKDVVKILSNKGDYDLFISCDEDSILFPSTIQEIKKRFSIPTVLICWDNLELPYKQKGLAKVVDLVWLTSIETKYLFDNWGCNTIFQTYAANPNVYYPNWEKNKNEVCFIGSPYGSRTNKINDLINGGINCNVFSDVLFDMNYNPSRAKKQIYIPDVLIKFTRYLRFPIGRKVLYSTIVNKLNSNSKLIDTVHLNKHQSVSLNEMINIYSNYSLSLNITELRDTYLLRHPIHKIHLRAFEIPMSGGLQLASYTEELSNYFEEGKEIVFYRSKEEMIEKTKFYLNPKNDKLVQDMKIQARRRAENEHTWAIRFKNVVNKLGIQ